MPNWCNARMAVVLPTRNVERFKDLFLGHSEEENKNKDRYFARTFLNDSDEVERNDKGMSCVTVDFDCAWSVWSCMFDRTGYVDEKKCPSLQTIVKELEIQRIIGKSNEPGMGFEESIEKTESLATRETYSQTPTAKDLRLMMPTILRRSGKGWRRYSERRRNGRRTS